MARLRETSLQCEDDDDGPSALQMLPLHFNLLFIAVLFVCLIDGSFSFFPSLLFFLYARNRLAA